MILAESLDWPEVVVICVVAIAIVLLGWMVMKGEER
jgi:hypothetical protein